MVAGVRQPMSRVSPHVAVLITDCYDHYVPVLRERRSYQVLDVRLFQLADYTPVFDDQRVACFRTPIERSGALILIFISLFYDHLCPCGGNEA
jgi:hypothetical protein